MRFLLLPRGAWPLVVPAIGLAVFALGVPSAQAQVFGPPSTIYGSITDAAGPVPAGVPIEAYIGEKVCGKGKTELTGEGTPVTVYFTDVVAREQTPGCGAEGIEVRIKVGDRFARQTARWKAGPVQLDITFGDNVTPRAIPTFTPTATRTPAPGQTTAAGNTPGPSQQANTAVTAATGTIPAGSPGAGSPVPTLAGGLTINSASGSGPSAPGGGDGGFPIWAAVILALGGVAAVGGGVGYAMSRTRRTPDDESDAIHPASGR